MIMRFYLESDAIVFVKIDHSCVVFEDGYAPGFVEFLCRAEYSFFEKVIKGTGLYFFTGSIVFAVLHNAGECFMLAVFAPSLCHGLEFYVGRVSPLFMEIALYGLHLFKGE